ncbi:homocysteine S-methyltransferase family protein [Adlercreutzia sp. R7]|uniref:Homocysteine S-methyltransferase family protein n=1 Tax=Adlercreutzia wanghongyangiae TaxID=3111451 RepID=A0ABU6IFF5_9ACTN|nr:homocysteine S-methyltransferase family protein [Adlercreutzia sp. R7]
MADIALRFFKDMLVLSSPVDAALRRQGINGAREQMLTLLLEPETIEEAYRLEVVAGPQCLVLPTALLTPARLAELGMNGKGDELAQHALQAVEAFKPQHVLAEIGPCGLPLDASSKASLVENRDQYARAAHLFDGTAVDAVFLNGFAAADDLKCALMGVRKACDLPVFASVDVTADGALASGRGTLAEAVDVMVEFGAAVAGFTTLAEPTVATALAASVRDHLAAQGADLCVLASLVVGDRNSKQQGPTAENPYCTADTMMAAAADLRAAGVQFLRAAGDATPAYTGVLAATVAGQDVVVG